MECYYYTLYYPGQHEKDLKALRQRLRSAQFQIIRDYGGQMTVKVYKGGSHGLFRRMIGPFERSGLIVEGSEVTNEKPKDPYALLLRLSYQETLARKRLS